MTEDATANRPGELQQIIFETATEPWHLEQMKRLVCEFSDLNHSLFDGTLNATIGLAAPGSPKVLGGCSPIVGLPDGWAIWIRPSIIDGSHPAVSDDPELQHGRDRLATDVMLHQMVTISVGAGVDEGYHGHGPAFRDEANRVGELLGLPPVRTMKRRGPDKDLPSASEWPMCVRPAGYYDGAYLPNNDQENTMTDDTDPLLWLQAKGHELGGDIGEVIAGAARCWDEASASKKFSIAHRGFGIKVIAGLLYAADLAGRAKNGADSIPSLLDEMTKKVCLGCSGLQKRVEALEAAVNPKTPEQVAAEAWAAEHIGEVLGELTVVRAGEKEGRVVLRCTCGVEIERDLNGIRNAKSQMCPDCRGRRHREAAIDKLLGKMTPEELVLLKQKLEGDHQEATDEQG